MAFAKSKLPLFRHLRLDFDVFQAEAFSNAWYTPAIADNEVEAVRILLSII
jgi:hypothetical protein